MLNKSILVVGPTSFLGRKFIEARSDRYQILTVGRSNADFIVDLLKFNELEDQLKNIDQEINGIIFFQGINPSMDVRKIDVDHFESMLGINLIVPTVLIRSMEKRLSKDCSIIFFTSNSSSRGGYDPSYSAAKAGVRGLLYSLSNAYTAFRFNMISLGLVEDSTVYNKMSKDFQDRHKANMYGGELIKVSSVIEVIDLLIHNKNFSKAEIQLDGGFR